MTAKIHLVHGIHSGGLNDQAHRLLPFLAKTHLPVVFPDYGYILGVESARINPIVVGTMLAYVEPGDVMVGHSNGCAIIHRLMQLGAPMQGAVFINAALAAGIEIPPQVKWVEVLSNEGDDITELAKVAAALELVDRCWGEMGSSGYTGKDPRVRNVYCDKEPGLPVLSGHSEIFAHENLPHWGVFIAARIAHHLARLG